MENIKIGDVVGWSSMAGYKEGTVKNIVLATNAAGKIVPWIDVEYAITNYRGISIDMRWTRVRLCASQENLTMMKVVRV